MRRSDRLLCRLVELRDSPTDAVLGGFPRRMVDDVRRRLVGSQFKRRPPRHREADTPRGQHRLPLPARLGLLRTTRAPRSPRRPRGIAGPEQSCRGGAAPRGSLFVVATPIGHLDDLSPRAVEYPAPLRSHRLRGHARHARDPPTVTRLSSPRRDRCHAVQRDAARTRAFWRRSRDGVDVALVSDGGTPGLSDPGGAGGARGPLGWRTRSRRSRVPRR